MVFVTFAFVLEIPPPPPLLKKLNNNIVPICSTPRLPPLKIGTAIYIYAGMHIGWYTYIGSYTFLRHLFLLRNTKIHSTIPTHKTKCGTKILRPEMAFIWLRENLHRIQFLPTVQTFSVRETSVSSKCWNGGHEWVNVLKHALESLRAMCRL